MTVYTAHTGSNADLIVEVGKLYIEDGALVADVTYGRGAFWKKTDTSRFKLHLSDIQPQVKTCPHSRVRVKKLDFRKLPYRKGSMDVVVLDPPYVHNPGQHVTDKRYNNAATTAGMYNADILALYEEGMREAHRVLRTEGGRLFVKCKDEVESGVQRWSHVRILEAALAMGFVARDLFVLIPSSRTTSNRWENQIHARKNHSFLWVFEKPDDVYRKACERKPPRRKTTRKKR